MVTLAEVARLRSLSQAARQLHLSTGAVSRRIDNLEQRLGVRLLHRSTRLVALTTEGSQYLSEILPALDAIAMAGDRLGEGNQQIRGNIRAVFPVNYGRLYIAPHLAEFLLRHPQVRLEAIFDDNFNDIPGEGLDLAVRIGQLEDSRLVARRIATDSRVLVASANYLDKHGTPVHPTDLLHHNCLHYTHFRGPQRWHLQRNGERLSIAVDGNLRADYGLALTMAAEGGLGIVQTARSIIHDALADGRLCEVLCDWSLPDIGVHAVTPSREVPARVKALIDFLAERLPDA
ncbi:hypothetical protein AR456_00030 [Halomonas huangheensis]|nr:hypothetical protein AR456_00030 [Halomonas huangheensis]